MNLHQNLNALKQSADANKNTYESIATDEKRSFEWLEKFPSPCSIEKMNPNGVTLTLKITTNEFTSLCPMTGQPDFAEIIINYSPDKWCVESKSLKLYFLSFRNRRDFHEACVAAICNDLVILLDPLWINVEGRFTARGGIPFWPTCVWRK